jgi:hypothetical protein
MVLDKSFNTLWGFVCNEARSMKVSVLDGGEKGKRGKELNHNDCKKTLVLYKSSILSGV